MDKMYVVMGYTGEYDDATEWQVCAYTDEALAMEHAKRATEYAKQFKYSWNSPVDRWKSPWDRDIRFDYTGTEYSVKEIEVRMELPIVP